VKHTCLACPAPREEGKYLCGPCWFQLPASSRQALYSGDRRAFARLRELTQQIQHGVPLADIHITH
jgi:hypothetical protein